MIKSFFKGVVIGIANIVPGVSGGTMMVSMGIYDKLIHCITHLTPMYWSDDAGYAGLCSGPADMEDFDMKFPSFEDQKADGDSIFWFVAQTIRLRNAYPAIARGTAVLEEALSNENVCVLRKTWGEEEVLLAFNISEAAQSVDLSGVTVSGGDPEIGGVLVTSAEEPVLEDGHLSMPMYSVVVLSHSK